MENNGYVVSCERRFRDCAVGGTGSSGHDDNHGNNNHDNSDDNTDDPNVTGNGDVVNGGHEFG